MTLIFWAFLSGMLLLAGARLSVSLKMEEAATTAAGKPAFQSYLDKSAFSNMGNPGR